MSGVPAPLLPQGGPCHPFPLPTLGPREDPGTHTLIPMLPQNTPDEDFILDRHPQYSNIIIGAGFSGRQGQPASRGTLEIAGAIGVAVPPHISLLFAGHGFKLAPVVGKLLCELSLSEEPSHSMAPFAIARFPNVLQAAL